MAGSWRSTQPSQSYSVVGDDGTSLDDRTSRYYVAVVKVDGVAVMLGQAWPLPLCAATSWLVGMNPSPG